MYNYNKSSYKYRAHITSLTIYSTARQRHTFFMVFDLLFMCVRFDKQNTQTIEVKRLHSTSAREHEINIQIQ